MESHDLSNARIHSRNDKEDSKPLSLKTIAMDVSFSNVAVEPDVAPVSSRSLGSLGSMSSDEGDEGRDHHSGERKRRSQRQLRKQTGAAVPKSVMATGRQTQRTTSKMSTALGVSILNPAMEPALLPSRKTSKVLGLTVEEPSITEPGVAPASSTNATIGMASELNGSSASISIVDQPEATEPGSDSALMRSNSKVGNASSGLLSLFPPSATEPAPSRMTSKINDPLSGLQLPGAGASGAKRTTSKVTNLSDSFSDLSAPITMEPGSYSSPMKRMTSKVPGLETSITNAEPGSLSASSYNESTTFSKKNSPDSNMMSPIRTTKITASVLDTNVEPSSEFSLSPQVKPLTTSSFHDSPQKRMSPMRSKLATNCSTDTAASVLDTQEESELGNQDSSFQKIDHGSFNTKAPMRTTSNNKPTIFSPIRSGNLGVSILQSKVEPSAMNSPESKHQDELSISSFHDSPTNRLSPMRRKLSPMNTAAANTSILDTKVEPSVDIVAPFSSHMDQLGQKRGTSTVPNLNLSVLETKKEPLTGEKSNNDAAYHLKNGASIIKMAPKRSNAMAASIMPFSEPTSPAKKSTVSPIKQSIVNSYKSPKSPKRTFSKSPKSKSPKRKNVQIRTVTKANRIVKIMGAGNTGPRLTSTVNPRLTRDLSISILQGPGLLEPGQDVNAPSTVSDSVGHLSFNNTGPTRTTSTLPNLAVSIAETKVEPEPVALGDSGILAANPVEPPMAPTSKLSDLVRKTSIDAITDRLSPTRSPKNFKRTFSKSPKLSPPSSRMAESSPKRENIGGNPIGVGAGDLNGPMKIMSTGDNTNSGPKRTSSMDPRISREFSVSTIEGPGISEPGVHVSMEGSFSIQNATELQSSISSGTGWGSASSTNVAAARVAVTQTRQTNSSDQAMERVKNTERRRARQGNTRPGAVSASTDSADQSQTTDSADQSQTRNSSDQTMERAKNAERRRTKHSTTARPGAISVSTDSDRQIQTDHPEPSQPGAFFVESDTPDRKSATGASPMPTASNSVDRSMERTKNAERRRANRQGTVQPGAVSVPPTSSPTRSPTHSPTRSSTRNISRQKSGDSIEHIKNTERRRARDAARSSTKKPGAMQVESSTPPRESSTSDSLELSKNAERRRARGGSRQGQQPGSVSVMRSIDSDPGGRNMDTVKNAERRRMRNARGSTDSADPAHDTDDDPAKDIEDNDALAKANEFQDSFITGSLSNQNMTLESSHEIDATNEENLTETRNFTVRDNSNGNFIRQNRGYNYEVSFGNETSFEEGLSPIQDDRSKLDSASCCTKRRVVLFSLLVVLILGGVAGAVLILMGDGINSDIGTGPSNDTASPGPAFESIRLIVEPITALPESLLIESTPQYSAVKWLSENGLAGDVASDIDESSTIKLRTQYALATFYFATKVRQEILDSIGDDFCTWPFVSCGGMEGNEILSINATGESLIGHVPLELEYLSSLVSFDVSGNFFKSIDLFWSQLLFLDASRNKLSGGIPQKVYRMTSLEHLDLSDNNLEGSIGNDIGGLTRLTSLELNSNYLTAIETTLVGLSSLRTVDIRENRIVGDFNHVFGGMHWLEHIKILENQFIGSVTPDIGNYTQLESLDLESNNLKGTLPTEIGLLSNLSLVALHDNKFTGMLPDELFQLTALTTLSFSMNPMISGTLPAIKPLRLLRRLSFFDVGLTGSLPSEIGLATSLTILDFRRSGLSGQIPTEIGELTRMETFLGADNFMDGRFVSEIGRLSNLKNLQFDRTSLAGDLPSELSNLSNVEVLSIFSTDLVGTIPPQMCPSLIRLNVDCGKVDCSACSTCMC